MAKLESVKVQDDHFFCSLNQTMKRTFPFLLDHMKHFLYLFVSMYQKLIPTSDLIHLLM
jgi:hypothetical protein